MQLNNWQHTQEEMDMNMHVPDAAPVATNNTDGNSTSPPKPIRRACDCCRKRKVKCDGSSPCGPCTKASIHCAYLQPPKKKGPKGLRSARVLHALRKIDEHASRGPISPISPDQSGAFGNWGWDQQSTPPRSVPYANNMQQQQQDAVFGPHTSVPPDQTYFPQMPTAMPQPPPTSNPTMYPLDTSTTWSTQPESVSADGDIPSILTPSGSEPIPIRLPGDSFLPYMRLFYEHMFVIMPVIDRTIYLDPTFYSNTSVWSSDLYCFICAICAGTIVQLQVNDNMPELPPLHPTKTTDDLFADECLRERKAYDYIDNPSTLSVMASFFLFAYYGNHEKHGKAWHYLQETIAFAENLDMDDEKSYLGLAPIEAQWRRRLYWLLFITERAYAIQRRKHARLPKTVQQPSVLDNEHPEMLNGFNNVGLLFAAIDDNFVRAWKGSRKQSLCNEAWLAQTQEQIDKVSLALGNITETQQLDISVTREWLHVLAWQLGVSNGLMWGDGDEVGMNLRYPVELARKVVQITSGANSLAMDSHGIGMEQKLSDIAGCLADVLKCTVGDTTGLFVEGKHYLNILLQQLSRMRGKESRYLKPLMQKMQGLMAYGQEDQNAGFNLQPDANASYPMNSNPNLLPGGGVANGLFDGAGGNGRLTPRWSFQDSMGMLRTLSMSGGLGMPGLGGGLGINVPSALPSAPPMEDWRQRRPSGRVYDEGETEGMDGWWGDGVGVGVAAQAV